ncbi:MAG: PHP domain-containing protein, partial [Bacteroidales bacterium]|nr:PHP domain-containing protein [Bacteroidales bacterium]
MVQFTHLHVHSHFSFLDGMSKIPDLIAKAKKCGMLSMALTDHGNMYGIKEFVDASNKTNEELNKEIEKLTEKIDPKDKNKEGEEATPLSPEEIAETKAKIAELESQLFKPILGLEAYCAHKSRVEKD